MNISVILNYLLVLLTAPALYKCRKSYCIDHSRVCDGEVDCNYGDDEVSCDKHTCPGKLHCMKSMVCIILKEACDGHKHCPRGDDELNCHHYKCPANCKCFNHAVYCRNCTIATVLLNVINVKLLKIYQCHSLGKQTAVYDIFKLARNLF